METSMDGVIEDGELPGPSSAIRERIVEDGQIPGPSHAIRNHEAAPLPMAQTADHFPDFLNLHYSNFYEGGGRSVSICKVPPMIPDENLHECTMNWILRLHPAAIARLDRTVVTFRAIILQGSAKLTTLQNPEQSSNRNRSQNLREGESVFIKKGTEFDLQNTGNQTCYCWMIVYSELATGRHGREGGVQQTQIRMQEEPSDAGLREFCSDLLNLIRTAFPRGL